MLVAACGDGLETELLARKGFDVTAFDFAPNMVEATQSRLTRNNLSANLYVDDLTDLQLNRYNTDFAGVMFAQASAFLPVVGEHDELLSKAVTDLASRTTKGALYISTTYYANPRHTRPWILDNEVVGETTYYARPTHTYTDMMQAAGLVMLKEDHFDAGDTPPDDYKNDYFIAARPAIR